MAESDDAETHTFVSTQLCSCACSSRTRPASVTFVTFSVDGDVVRVVTIPCHVSDTICRGRHDASPLSWLGLIHHSSIVCLVLTDASRAGETT